MRVGPPGPSGRNTRPRVLLAAGLAWAVVAVLGLLPFGGVLPQAHADSGVTVEGPKVWRPSSQSYGPAGSVSVTPANGLTDQVIRVSWKGFTPTVDGAGRPVATVRNPHDGTADSNARYPVRVYQCRGTDPGPTDCYGSTLYGADPGKGFQQPAPAAGLTTPEFPSNMAIAATRPDGSGQASIEVWTAQQSQSLGCDAGHPCSLVIEAEYGGDSLGAYQRPLGAINCDDHEGDSDFFFNEATDASFYVNNLGHTWRSGEACAWTHRAVVPLTFAPSAADCQAKAADFKAMGLEMANRAMQQWRAGLCQGASPLSVQYTFGGGEPQARARFLQRAPDFDVALTARPDSSPASRPYVYAPLADSAISVVYVVDDAVSHQQIRQLKLNARLLAKMLTQSYILAGQDNIPSVSGNPRCVFEDPEFLQLNPVDKVNGPNWPACGATADLRNTAPVVVGGTTDLVHQLTAWLAADPAAGQFLQGAPDPWGTHLDAYYLKPKFPGYPVDAFQPQDYSGPGNWKQYEWNPVLGGLDQVARSAMQSQPSCLNPNVNPTGGHDKCQVQTVGSRQFFAVLDAGEAQALSLPEAALQNPAGNFVTPTLTGMRAAVADMPVDPATGTQQLPYGDRSSAFAKDADAYPLTMVQYAMLPTGGLDPAKAAAVARFVQQVTDPGGGQVYGSQPGQLAVGYAGLTDGQLASAQDAVRHVQAQDKALPGNQKAGQPGGGPDGGTPGGGGTSQGGGPGSSGSSGGGALPAGGAGGDGTAGGTGGGAGAQKPGAPAPSGAAAAVAAGQPSPDRAGLTRWLLPVALVIGAAALVGGPAALALSGTPAGRRVIATAQQAWNRATSRA